MVLLGHGSGDLSPHRGWKDTHLPENPTLGRSLGFEPVLPWDEPPAHPNGGHEDYPVAAPDTAYMDSFSERWGLHTISQWVHQHDLLLTLILIFGVSLGPLVRYRRRSARLWIAWGAALGLSGVALAALRTPEASLSEHVSRASDFSPEPVAPSATLLTYEVPAFGSVEAIHSLLSDGGKHTLVEIYADFGIS